MEPETIKFKLHYSSAYKKRIFVPLAFIAIALAFFVVAFIIDYVWSSVALAFIFASQLVGNIWVLPVSITADDNGLTLKDVIGKTNVKRGEIVSIQPLSALDGSVQLKWRGYDVKIGGKTMLPVPKWVTNDSNIVVVTIKEPKRTAYQYAISCPDEATLQQLCQWGS